MIHFKYVAEVAIQIPHTESVQKRDIAHITPALFDTFEELEKTILKKIHVADRYLCYVASFNVTEVTPASIAAERATIDDEFGGRLHAGDHRGNNIEGIDTFDAFADYDFELEI